MGLAHRRVCEIEIEINAGYCRRSKHSILARNTEVAKKLGLTAPNDPKAELNVGGGSAIELRFNLGMAW